jgi:hypothetical protein
MCLTGCLSRRHFLVGAAFSVLPPFPICQAQTMQRQLQANWIADLAVQPSSSGSSITIDTVPYVISQNFWDDSISPTLEQFANLLSLANPHYFYPIAIKDEGRPTYAAVDGHLLGVDVSHDGVLLIGEQMTRSLITRFGGKENGAAVSGSLAHELAHLFQFRNGPEGGGTWWTTMLNDDGDITRRKVELHADFIAGWCLGQSPRGLIDFLGIDVFARRLYEFGEMDDLDPNSHGTPQQRYAVMLRGFFLGRNDKVSAADAAAEGRLFVNAIVPMRAEQ